MILRTEHSVEDLVPWLETNIGPITSWLHDRVTGRGWCVVPYSDYRKVYLPSDLDATLLLLAL